MGKPVKKFIKKQTFVGDNPLSSKGQIEVIEAENPKEHEGKSTGVSKTIGNADLQKEKKTVNSAVTEIPIVDLNATLQIEEKTGFMEEHFTPEPDGDDPAKMSDENIEKSNTKLFIIGVFLTTLIIAGSIGIFYFDKKLKPQEEKPQVITKEQIQQPRKEKTVFDRSSWSLEILNGSGVAGTAKVAAAKVDAQGYKVVKTGNADKQNYQKTALLVSKEFADRQNLVLEDLKGTFGSIELVGELKDSTASARIIVGKN